MDQGLTWLYEYKRRMSLKMISAELCLKSRKSLLDRVSTGSGSDLVSDQHAIFPERFVTPTIDQVATLYMKGRPIDVSLELFEDLKLASEGEPYENVLCWHGRASRNDRDRRS